MNLNYNKTLMLGINCFFDGGILANLTGTERAHYVRAMFSQIAPRYDLMNRVMTAGQDARWRREVIARAALPLHGRLLDLGAGTGDLSREALKQFPTCTVLAADFTLEMMQVGQTRIRQLDSLDRKIHWCTADGQLLPFPSRSFDAVVSGFLLRNVSDVLRCLSEQYRVLKPGGRIIVLDTTPPPPHSPLAPFIHIHLHSIIPTLGRILAGQGEAYQYLPDSTESFLEPEQLADRLATTGFRQVAFRRLMFGTVAIHWGQKG